MVPAVLDGRRGRGPPVRTTIRAMGSPAVVGIGSAALSAVLAFWLVLRFPRLGPQSAAGALTACVLAFALLGGIGPAFIWTRDAANPAVALLAVAVPFLGFSFWSGAVLLRTIVAGPGPGRPERVRARSRRRG